MVVGMMAGASVAGCTAAEEEEGDEATVQEALTQAAMTRSFAVHNVSSARVTASYRKEAGVNAGWMGEWVLERNGRVVNRGSCTAPAIPRNYTFGFGFCAAHFDSGTGTIRFRYDAKNVSKLEVQP